MAELPCDADGLCMVCKTNPPDSDVLLCNSCSSPWHMACLKTPMETVPLGDWYCPDCNFIVPTGGDSPQKATVSKGDNDVVSQIRAIQADETLTNEEKARRCQDVMSKGTGGELKRNSGGLQIRRHKMLEIFDENLNCTFCMQLADRPVTTPCGHNFCLKCFQRWVGQGKKTCGKCRTPIPSKMASQPRINSALVIAIRMAKSAVNPCGEAIPPKPYHYIQNEDRPDKAFTTERAKKPGKANAASGKIFVTVPPDHFGPITAENDPVRRQGVLVGETWEDRMECRQWGVHLPHVAGIAGQSDYGSQSVALSGGYEDDEDHGEWFLYTGSGGRDLSGNKRTNDKQSFDQKFDKSNEALRVSCKRGYPVRVVRSHKEKRSSYAPESGVRYDGIYRIEKCWRKIGIQGFKVCRYLFVRCDNEPAAWTSDEHGDRPRSLPKIDELKAATDITERKSEPAWDWKDEEGRWGWTRAPPPSRKLDDGSGTQRQGLRKSLSIGQRLLKEFGCSLCKKVLRLPLSTPCGHNFCKACLESAFAGQKDVRERARIGGRSLRVQKVVRRCPSCQGDITEFLINPQVNRQMEDVIQSLKNNAEEQSDTENNVRKEEDQEECIDGTAVKTKSSEVEKDTTNLPIGINSICELKAKDAICKSDFFAAVCDNGSACNGSRKTQSSVGGSDKSCHHSNDIKAKNDATADRAIQELCLKYPDYSKELLHSMLMDQEGDVLELGSLLKALKRQENKAMQRQKNSGSPSQVGKNTDRVHERAHAITKGKESSGDEDGKLASKGNGGGKERGGKNGVESSIDTGSGMPRTETQGCRKRDKKADEDALHTKRLCLRGRVKSREASSYF